MRYQLAKSSSSKFHKCEKSCVIDININIKNKKQWKQQINLQCLFKQLGYLLTSVISIKFTKLYLTFPKFRAGFIFARLIFAHFIFVHPEKNVFRAILIFAQLVGNIILCKIIRWNKFKTVKQNGHNLRSFTKWLKILVKHGYNYSIII